MTSCHGSGHRWILITKHLWYGTLFLTVEWIVKLPGICNAMMLICRRHNVYFYLLSFACHWKYFMICKYVSIGSCYSLVQSELNMMMWSNGNMFRVTGPSIGETAWWLQLQPSSSWPRPSDRISIFPLVCPNKAHSVSFLSDRYIVCQRTKPCNHCWCRCRS